MPGAAYRWAKVAVAVATLAAPLRTAHAAAEDDLTLDLGATSLALRRIPKGTFVQGLREPRRARSAARHESAPGARNADYGFRIAMDDDARAASSGDDGAKGPGAAADLAPAGDAADLAPTGDASAPAVAPRPGAEGSGWALAFAPFAGAALAVGWVLARRRLGHAPPPVPEPLAERAAPVYPPFPLPLSSSSLPAAKPVAPPSSSTMEAGPPSSPWPSSRRVPLPPVESLSPESLEEDEPGEPDPDEDA